MSNVLAHRGIRSSSVMVSRARVIFPVLLLLNLLTTTGAGAVGYQTGELQTRFIEPARENAKFLADSFVKSIGDALQSEFMTSEAPKTNYEENFTSKVETRIETNINITNGEGKSEIRVNGQPFEFKWVLPTPKPNPTPQLKTDFSWGPPAEFEAWVKKVQEDFKATGDKYDQNFAEFDRQARENQEKFKAESQRKVEEFKAKYGL